MVFGLGKKKDNGIDNLDATLLEDDILEDPEMQNWNSSNRQFPGESARNKRKAIENELMIQQVEEMPTCMRKYWRQWMVLIMFLMMMAFFL